MNMERWMALSMKGSSAVSEFLKQVLSNSHFEHYISFLDFLYLLLLCTELLPSIRAEQIFTTSRYRNNP